MRPILVTGGAGYIGSHACKALAQAGFQPVVYDNLSTGHADAVKWGPLEPGDIRDADRLTRVLAHWRPAAVMHFAALSLVGESVTEPDGYYSTNVGGTLNLLRSMRLTDVPVLVFSSTCAVFGTPERVPISEGAPWLPINPYGRSKRMIEEILLDFDAAYGLRHVALRYFNAAGADPDGELAERHEPETHAVPLCIRAAVGRLPHFTIFGTDYPTPDGTAIRDYVHVSDLAEAHVLALRRLLGGGASRAYNLGQEQGTSVRDLIAAVGRVAGRPVPVVAAARRPGDPPRLVADARRARAELGWEPRFRSMDDIVATCFAAETAAGTAALQTLPS